MNKLFSFGRYLLLIPLIIQSCDRKPEYIKVAVTTDVHGMIFPVDLVSGRESNHSLAHINNYVLEQQGATDTSFLLMDNGDFLQGQPTVYYYNFLDTTCAHLSARVMNYMGYVAGTVGNHDIEAGPDVYNKISDELGFPWLAANAVNRKTGQPFFKPYTVLRSGSRKIAVLGLITPGIPNWLPGSFWPGMEFLDMVETAKKWVPIIKRKVNPDLLIGLFHSGTDFTYGGTGIDSENNENATILVAQEVPGFDIIFAGHDHKVTQQWVINSNGDSVLVIDPGSHARYIGEGIIHFSGRNDKDPSIKGRIIPASNYEPSDSFMEMFMDDFKQVEEYLSDTIVILNEKMAGLDALFGPASITSLIHRVQLDISRAEISFTSPLSIHSVLQEGPLLVSDMFNLYRFENMLTVMKLSGIEIDRFLEYSVSLWLNIMKDPGDHLLLFEHEESARLKNPYYNFSTAAGIDYTVDLTKPNGNRVNITGLSNGRSFSLNESYSVAINSYRGNGGGGHLTTGAGIPKKELSNRIEWSSEMDLRYYLMEELIKLDTLQPFVYDNWRCIPEEFWKRGRMTDKALYENMIL